MPRFFEGVEVFTVQAADAKESLGLGVERLEVVVTDGPVPDGAGDTVRVISAGMEVLPAGPQQSAAVQGSAAAKDAADIEPFRSAVQLDRSVIVRLLLDQGRAF